MAEIMLRGAATRTNGELPAVGTKAPDFRLVDKDLKDCSLASWKGKKKLISILPSLDTPVCATSTKKFDQHAKDHPDTVILTVAADLPFAMKRFCGAEGLANVVTLSLMRDRRFAEDYGVLITDGPLAGITARAIVVLSAEDTVKYTELVPDIAQEPDYQAALRAL